MPSKSMICGVVVMLAVGCTQTTNTHEDASRLQEYVDGWERMGMWLPDQEQVDLFHACLPDSERLLESSLSSPAHEVRMRAAYVIDKIGPDAAALGPALTRRLKDEPDRLVRMYLYPALRNTGYAEPQSLALLKERFASLDVSDTEPEPGQSNSDYVDADEKISVASALSVLVRGPDRKAYLDFILSWLRPDERLAVSRREDLWDRRRLAVLDLQDMPDSGEAIPLLEALQKEKDAPPWVSVHVPRVLQSLKVKEADTRQPASKP